jgi:hypothetical protein
VRGIAPEAVMLIAETVTAVFGKHSNDALFVRACVCKISATSFRLFNRRPVIFHDKNCLQRLCISMEPWLAMKGSANLLSLLLTDGRFYISAHAFIHQIRVYGQLHC